MRTLSPPAWFLAALVAMQGLKVLLPGPQWIGKPWRLSGLVLIGAGMALHAWASRTFVRAGTTIEPEGRPTALVREGPYGLTRNPMYLAGIPILAGWAVLLGVATPLFVLLLYPFLASRWIAREEARMEMRFGVEWRGYADSVRRWI